MIGVMIVEDDPMVMEINSKFLKRVEGFTFLKGVSNLQEAKKYMLSKKPDLILLDVYLPNENGIDFLKWIRSQALDADVILITADKSMERIQQAFRYGVVDYLIKPFRFERFREALLQYKDRYDSFKNSEVIEQKDLDRYLSGQISAQNEEDFTKGVNKYTYCAIWEKIEQGGEEYYTAENLAEMLQIARVTVRRYLELMEKEEKIYKLVEYGKVGRPQHKYRKL
ncbi:MAG: response regulator [Paenibacillaceae bacterium]|uniref:response regulator n=1 Tax=Lacrimispora xylanisolvens TaxID=384636 RepID=UPI000CEBA00F|nr:response regulator [Hungatella xylanolytica]MBE5989406.1 response regulator [Paenibacillaceae bacterium]